MGAKVFVTTVTSRGDDDEDVMCVCNEYDVW